MQRKIEIADVCCSLWQNIDNENVLGWANNVQKHEYSGFRRHTFVHAHKANKLLKISSYHNRFKFSQHANVNKDLKLCDRMRHFFRIYENLLQLQEGNKNLIKTSKYPSMSWLCVDAKEIFRRISRVKAENKLDEECEKFLILFWYFCNIPSRTWAHNVCVIHSERESERGKIFALEKSERCVWKGRKIFNKFIFLKRGWITWVYFYII